MSARGLARCALAMTLVLGALGCDSDPDPDPTMDSGLPPGVDGGPRPDGGPGSDGGGPAPGVDGGPGGCVPGIEVCGDRMDQNCDGRDQSCGDNDGDLWDACRAEDNLMNCDCDDSRADVYPARNADVPGATEACDGVDNDCNGRVDDAPECCSGCAGIEPERADVCTPANECECSTEAGTGPCGAGRFCCSGGCVDVMTNPDHCGSCRGCGGQADTCIDGACSCGASGRICDFTNCCVGGSCVARMGDSCPGD